MDLEKGVAIYGNPKQDAYVSRIGALLDKIRGAGMSLCLSHEFGCYLESRGLNVGNEIYTEFPAHRVHTLMSIGGDGTFLRAAQWAGGSGVPMIGINSGHLGFLANYTFDDEAEIISLLSEDTRCLERRMVLRVECDGMPDDFWPYALNEVALLKSDSASMVTVRTWIDGEYLADYESDGLIIASPTGSTAYNLSVGGPILEPTVSNMVLSPVAPHSLTMRPLVIGGDSEVRAEVRCGQRRYRVSLDGRTFRLKGSLRDENRMIRITRAPFTVNVLRRPGKGFSDILRDKLLWSRR